MFGKVFRNYFLVKLSYLIVDFRKQGMSSFLKSAFKNQFYV